MKVNIKGKKILVEEIKKSKSPKPEDFIGEIAKKIGGEKIYLFSTKKEKEKWTQK